MSGTGRSALATRILASLLAFSTTGGIEATKCRAVESVAESSSGENQHLWNPKTRTVAVFKNGLAFFTQEGSVTPRDGWCYAQDVPPAAFGTLAIYALNSEQVVNEFYDLVTLRGTVRRKWFEKLPVDVQVTLPIDGRPTAADAGGVIRMDATKLRLLERSGSTSWTCDIPGRDTDERLETSATGDHHAHDRYACRSDPRKTA